MILHVPTLFDFLDDGAGESSSAPARRIRGRPKLAPLPRGSGNPPTKAQREADALLSPAARREALNLWVVAGTRKPNRRDYTRAVLQVLADQANLEPQSPGYLRCVSLTQREIADRIGVSRRCVAGVISQLREAKRISSVRISRTCTRYTLFASPLSIGV